MTSDQDTERERVKAMPDVERVERAEALVGRILIHADSSGDEETLSTLVGAMAILGGRIGLTRAGLIGGLAVRIADVELLDRSADPPDSADGG